jgi:hypothetical protein
MTAEQTAAFVNAAVARAKIKMAAMQAMNDERAQKGLAQAYGEDAFVSLIDDEGISFNAIIQLYQDNAQ